ncbi:MAG: hypothetical protein U0746_17995 [Gemmataceae bacterium]
MKPSFIAVLVVGSFFGGYATIQMLGQKDPPPAPAIPTRAGTVVATDAAPPTVEDVPVADPPRVAEPEPERGAKKAAKPRQPTTKGRPVAKSDPATNKRFETLHQFYSDVADLFDQILGPADLETVKPKLLARIAKFQEWLADTRNLTGVVMAKGKTVDPALAAKMLAVQERFTTSLARADKAAPGTRAYYLREGEKPQAGDRSTPTAPNGRKP